MPTIKKNALFAAVFCTAVAVASERVSLDRDWNFSLDGAPVRIVDVPHDWSVEGVPDKANASGAAGGYYPGGVGVYTRTFLLSKDDLGKELELVFDGVYREAEVSVNGGAPLKGTFYGYTGFSVPLAEGSVRAGANTLKVTARNDRQPNCRWYSGSGIYRHVWLVKHERGRRVADIAVRTSLDGTVTVTGTVGGKPETKTFKVANPVLWTPETPKLYDFDFFGERVRTGIRTVGWDKDNGLLLNGVSVKLHGACVHHDHGPLGAASYDAAELRKVRQLKAAGFNAVRTSHNPVSEAFLDACDTEGLLVVDDMFDGWRSPKTDYDYSVSFGEKILDDLSWTVRRDRLHPSVVMWSIGNEILERTSPKAVADSKALAARCRELDPTRPVTMALCSWGGEREWLAQDELAATLDIAGYNYMEEFTESDKARCPGRIAVYTETYPRDAANVWRRIMKHGYVVGEFVWTGIDYLGESTIGRTYYEGKEAPGEHYEVSPAFPWHGAYCGDIDLTGWRKPISHWRETLWNPKAPTYLAVREPDGWRGKIKETRWSVWPTWERWNFEGWEGKKVVAEVYTRSPKVTLYLNGKPVGERAVGEETAWKAEFELAYEPGELKVVDSDGGTSIIRTAGEPTGVRFTRERVGGLMYVTAEVVDANGTVCPDASQDVEFEGDVIATCSADLQDCAPATNRTRRTWCGRAMAVVREKSPAAESLAAAGEASFADFDARARRGERLSVVFFGGSLTYSANASDPNVTGVRGLLARYLESRYPAAHFSFHDAAIGGTGSLLGALRLERDVFAHKPDLVFLDFLCNDGTDDDLLDSTCAYEYLLREMIGRGIAVEQMFFTFKFWAGKGFDPVSRLPRRNIYRRLAEAYGTPDGDVHLSTLARDLESGKTTLDEVWPIDGGHPADLGYRYFFEAVREGFERGVEKGAVCRVPEKPVYGTLKDVRRTALVDGTLPPGWKRSLTYRTSMWFDGLSSRWMGDVAVAKGGAEPIRFSADCNFFACFGEGDEKGLKFKVAADGAPFAEFASSPGPGRLFIFRRQEFPEWWKGSSRHEFEISPVAAENGELHLESVMTATIVPSDPSAVESAVRAKAERAARMDALDHGRGVKK